MPWYSGPVPDSHITSRLRFVPLTEELVDADLAAVMASREYLHRWSDSSWPEDDFTRADNAEDLRGHRLEHEDGVAFTYSVLAASVERVVGCIYIRPLTDALETRDVDVSTDTLATALAEIVPDAAVVRGWIRSDEPPELLDALVEGSVAWLAGDSWGFPDVWWMASSVVPDQLETCRHAGLTRAISIPSGTGITWELRAAARPGAHGKT